MAESTNKMNQSNYLSRAVALDVLHEPVTSAMRIPPTARTKTPTSKCSNQRVSWAFASRGLGILPTALAGYRCQGRATGAPVQRVMPPGLYSFDGARNPVLPSINCCHTGKHGGNCVRNYVRSKTHVLTSMILWPTGSLDPNCALLDSVSYLGPAGDWEGILP